MIKRLTRFASRLKATPSRVSHLEALTANVDSRLNQLEASLRAVAVELEYVPGYFLAAEKRLIDQATTLVDSEIESSSIPLRAAIVEARQQAHEHTDAAVEASSKNTLAQSRAHAEAAASAESLATRSTAQAHAEALRQQTLAHLNRELATVRREIASVRRARSETSHSTAEGSNRPDQHANSTNLDPSFYVALEDRFRGDKDTIADRQRLYLDLVTPTVTTGYPAVDLGCGRGEWLGVLQRAGLPAIGVDSNPAFVAEVADDKLSVVDGDLLEFLRSATDRSFGAITMFQVVEHLPIDVLLEVLEHAVRVLIPGGVFIAETPNALNLRVGSSTFWIDPTHQRPLHPEFLQFCAIQAGFASAEGRFANELYPGYESIVDPVVRRLAEMVDGPGDFALVART